MTEQRKAEPHGYARKSVAYLVGLAVFSPKEFPFMSYDDPKLTASNGKLV